MCMLHDLWPVCLRERQSKTVCAHACVCTLTMCSTSLAFYNFPTVAWIHYSIQIYTHIAHLFGLK